MFFDNSSLETSELLEQLKQFETKLEAPTEEKTAQLVKSLSSPQRVLDVLDVLEQTELTELNKQITAITIFKTEITTLKERALGGKLIRKIQEKIIEMIQNETRDPLTLALKLYKLYSFIVIIFNEQSFLMENYQSIFQDFVGFLQISFSLYKILKPFLSYCVMISKFFNENIYTDEQKKQLTSNKTLETLTNITDIPVLFSTELEDLSQLQKNFKLLYKNKVFETLSYFGEYLIIIPNIAIALRKKDKVLSSFLHLPFLHTELPNFLTNIINNIMYRVVDASLSLGLGRLNRRKKTRYYKKKNKHHKRRVTQKIQNGPFIQTKEMMLSSYLLNNNKPIIRGYSIQKKFIPNKKLISIHTNIITNNNRSKTKKKRKN